MVSAERKAWLYVGRLKDTETEDNVKDYLTKNGIQGGILCEKLPTLGTISPIK